MHPDIVYLLKVDSENDSEELRYSLRSLKHIPHRNVFIAGEKPDWVRNVTYLPVAQTSTTKYGNVTRNLLTAILNPDLSENFILMNDDFFIMKELTEIPVYHLGTMEDILAWYRGRYGEDTPYIQELQGVNDLLVARGHKAPICYEAHVPLPVNKTCIKKLAKETAGEWRQFRSFYGNSNDVGGQIIKDPKLFIDTAQNPSEYNEKPGTYLDQQIFLSVTGGAFKRGVPGKYIRDKFSEKSIYEV